MTVKNIVFLTSQRLDHIVAVKIKKTHIYEFFAAAFGFNTYAALGNKVIFIKFDEPFTTNLVNTLKIRSRCIELGYTESVANSISAHFPIIIAEERLAVLNLHDLIAALRTDTEDFVFDNEITEQAKWTVNEWQLAEAIRKCPSTLKSLEDSANSGNGLAHYALALVYLNNGEWDEDEEISDYWFRQQQLGEKLNTVEMEFAYSYAEQMSAKEKSKYHLMEAALLNNEMALIDLAEYFDDPLFFDKALPATNTDPMKIAMIAEQLSRKGDSHHWLIVAAEAGNPQAMRELITNFEKHDLTRCWTWIYLSKLVNHDLAKDRYFAIHEDGSDYDDDVGGPPDVGGEGGIDLPDIETFQDRIAKRNAEELFRKIEISIITA